MKLMLGALCDSYRELDMLDRRAYSLLSQFYLGLLRVYFS